VTPDRATTRWLDQAVVDDEAASTFRVDRRVFGDRELFDRERTHIFEKCWLYVGHASELREPGDFVTRSVAGRPIVLVRGHDGATRALLNTCTHRGTRLCSAASGNARSFQCPLHAWTFDTRGRLLGVPGRDSYASSFATTGFDLHGLRCAAYRDFIFVTLDRDAPSLEDYLAGATEYLDLVADQSLGAGMELVPGSQTYGIHANWKLLAENSIDTYHPISLHRRWFDYVGDQGVRRTRPQGRGRQLGNGHGVIESWPPVAGKPVAAWGPPMPVSSKPAMRELQQRLVAAYGEDRAHRIGQTYRQLLIFPNLLVLDTVATTIRTFDPVAHDRIDVTAWALAPRGQPEEQRAAMLQSFLTFWGPGGFATPDDVEILESCQATLANHELRWADYSRGMARGESSFDDELQLRSFWRRWFQLVVDGAASGGTR
jgi:p-cumate 2,3-dioxygenase alpha subunit